MVTRKDYLDEAVEAARSVMIELVRLLGEYRESLVLIGGWVPELLLPNRERPHVGSIDVDLASESHVGPTAIADFEEITDSEERELIQRDAYERISYVLSKLGVG